MNKKEFSALTRSKVLVLDGATGTELARNGMPAGVSPEAWVIENQSVLIKIQQTYAEAGSDIVYTCTFGGNRLKLAEFGLDNKTTEINTMLADISCRALKNKALVFGDLAPTGQFIEPFGELAFEEAVEVYSEQARALMAGGVDGFVVETMMDLQEARAALIAIKECSRLPVMVSMTFGPDGRTLNGTDPLSALITLQSLGADAVGCNCSTGPQDMAKVIATMKPYATIPLLAKPNAGMPRLVGGVTTFDMLPEEFGQHVPLLVEAGACIIGGCCGTDPEYISEVRKKATNLPVPEPEKSRKAAVCSYRETVLISAEQPLTILGGKINPSGNPLLGKQLRKGDMALVRKMARDQARHGADIIDVNIHAKGVDEEILMPTAVLAAMKACGKPISIDTMNPEAVERTLRIFPGRAIVNSISAKERSLRRLCLSAKKYGAMIVCMPIDGRGVPRSTNDAVAIIEKILGYAEENGIAREECLVDCLVFTAAAEADIHKRTLELIDWCAKEGRVGSLCGISNVSFGLKERQWLDSTFLCMAAARKLTAAFIDVSNEQILNTAYAINALAARDPRFNQYLKHFSQQTTGPAAHGNKSRTPCEIVFDVVVAGDEEMIAEVIRIALDKGYSPRTLVDEGLIPAINLVGDKFDRKEYFLPQLITCADTMRKGFEVLQPLLNSGNDSPAEKSAKVILATVQGDIHDIGKNIVALMLKNYNFDVIDLGKDVSAEDIIRAAKKHHADIIGLSALMTTTMVEMKKVIDLAGKEDLKNIRFMIGGAVVDQHYADEIGAHGYAGDAIGAVRLARSFRSESLKALHSVQGDVIDPDE